MNLKFFVAGLLVLLLASCGTPKNLTYFKNVDKLSEAELTQMAHNYSTRISRGDQLIITVTAEDPNAVAAYNLPAFSYSMQGETEVRSTPTLQTYLVESDGCINFPSIGRIQIEGKSKQEVINLLTEKISEDVNNPIVTLQISNFKVTVLGEVTTPGTYPIENDRVTLLDALGMANDMTIYGDRTNVLLVRDNNGKMEFVRFDLTSPDIFSSPYFYLQQNDVVIVDPNKARKKNATYSQAGQFNVTIISTVVSALSVVMTLILALTK